VDVAQFAILFPTIALAFWVHGMPNQEAARGHRIYLVLFLQVFPRDKSVFPFFKILKE